MQQQLEQPKLPPSTKEQEKRPLRGWFFKKLGTYIDGIIINLLSAAILGGGLYLAQKIWGLRLIPFNVLDAIIIGSLSGIGILLLLVIILVLVFYRYFRDHPELIFGMLLVFAIFSFIMMRSKDKPIKWQFPPKEDKEPPQNSSSTDS